MQVERVDVLKQEVEELKAALHRAEYELENKGTEFEAGKVQVSSGWGGISCGLELSVWGR